MKNIFILLIITSLNSFSQNNNCENISNLVSEKGTEVFKDEVFVGGARFLEKVEFKILNNKYYALVKFDNNYKVYVYCELPKSSLDSFKNDRYIDKGKRYHKYIKPFKCDCN